MPTIEELAADPHGAHAALRQVGPVVPVASLGGWLVTTHAAAAAVLRDEETFTVDDLRFSTAQVIGKSMLSLDGAEHARHRSPFARGFGRRALEELYQGRIERTATRLVTDIAPAGSAEMRTSLASPLAVDSAATVLGLRDVDHAELRSWYDAIVAAVDEISAGREAGGSGRVAFEALSVAVTSAGSGAALQEARAVLTPAELASNAAVVLFGAIETGEGMIANLLWHVFGNEAIARAARTDGSLVSRSVEESLRLEPAAGRVDRYATRDTTVGDARIASGDLVIVSLAAANRDPDVFPDPDRFDPDRANVRDHLAFAVGPHACPGAHLARFEAEAALGAVLAGVPDARLVGGRSEAPTGLVFRKAKRVTLEWGSPETRQHHPEP
ncbi:MAG TPA: cytochrome P450 [Acidimicrobiia bacterium]|jgi:cytochrome P450